MTEAQLPTPTETMSTPQSGGVPLPSASQPVDPPSSMNLWTRLKDHKVAQWTLAYAAAAYTLLHITEMLSGAQEWPHIIVRVFSLVLILGVPVVVTLAWYHGAKALKRISGPELAIVTILLFIAGTILWVVSRPSAERPPAASAQLPAALAAPRTAVAVLPFANDTGDPSKEYLGDGLADELINTLSRVHGLKVPARTSTFAYKGRSTDIRQIAKDLTVGTIIEGNVRAAGKRLRISARLINAQDGMPLWTETYDEEFTDIFKLQDKLATQIAKALQPSLGEAAAQVVIGQGPPTQDVEAYNLYLKGWALVTKPSVSNLQQAIAYFQQAIDRDPKFARAYAGIAEAHSTWLRQTWEQREHADNAVRFARQALALDPQLASAHNALALMAGYRLQLFEMEPHSRMALAAGANDGWVHTIRALSLVNTGHSRESLAEAQKGYALAPANPYVVATLAYMHVLAGHEREALKFAEAAVNLGYPKGHPPLHLVYAYSAYRGKRYTEAGALWSGPEMGVGYESSPAAEAIRLVFAALADPARREPALAARNRLFPKSAITAADGAVREVYSCMDVALRYSFLEALDVAYDLANQCLDQFTVGQVLRLSQIWTPELRAFREDRRFQAFATRLGLMEYWQQYGPPDDCDLKDGKLTCH